MSLSGVLLGLILLVLMTEDIFAKCPPADKIVPCTCSEKKFGFMSYLTCENVINDREMRLIIQACQKFNIYSITIQESALNFLPGDDFQRTTFKEIEIFNSSLLALSDTDNLFKGLEKSLENLIVVSSNFMNTWRLSKLSTLRELNTLELSSGDLESLPVLNIRKLETLVLTSNRISWIHPNAFAKLKGIFSIDLYGNRITELKRSMFPNPASELNSLDFSFNKLQTLPDNLFTEMPQLKSLLLSGNHFYTFSKSWFQPVLSKLKLLHLDGNPLRCDCRIVWMTEVKLPGKFKAHCQDPASLRGRVPTELTARDLWCYFFNKPL